jgi:hypothetical protein
MMHTQSISYYFIAQMICEKLNYWSQSLLPCSFLRPPVTSRSKHCPEQQPLLELPQSLFFAWSEGPNFTPVPIITFYCCVMC